MTKSILISIQPQHAVNILNGDKTLELRKTVPKNFVGWVYIYCTKRNEYLVDKQSWIDFINKDRINPKKDSRNERYYTLNKKWESDIFGDVLNGKVVARFWFDEYEKVECRTVPYLKNGTKYDDYIKNGVYEVGNIKIDNYRVVFERYGVVFERDDELIKTMLKNNDLEKLRLTPQQIYDYIKLGKNGYLWHIKQLEIFDKPMQLSDFYIFPKMWIYPIDGYMHPPYYDEVKTVLSKAPQSWQYVYVEELENE